MVTGRQCVAACCAGVLALVLPLAAQSAPVTTESGWSEPVTVASGGAFRGPWRMNDSEFLYVDDPTVAFAADGSLGVAWVDNAVQEVFFRPYTADAEPVRQAASRVSRSPDTFSWLPRLVMGRDQADHVYVLWQEIAFTGGSHGGEILFARSTDGGERFEKPLNLSNTRAGAGKGRLTRARWDNGSLDLVEASDGTLIAAWTEYEGALRVSRSTDGGASFGEPLHVAGDDRVPARAPSLAVGERGRVYLAWTVGEDPAADIRLAISGDGGTTFGEARTVAETGGHSDAPALAVDGDGDVHLAFAESPDGPWRAAHIRYSRSVDGVTFPEPRPVSGTYPQAAESAAFPSLAVAGRAVHVLWELFPGVGQRPRGLALASSRNGGAGFGEPRTVPGTLDDDLGVNGGQQGLLMRKLAAGPDGRIAVVNSRFRMGDASHIRLVTGRGP